MDAIYEVSNVLGAGFLEKVYERARLSELTLRVDEHLAQCINYLRASGLKLALLVNFQKPKVEWKRVVYHL